MVEETTHDIASSVATASGGDHEHDNNDQSSHSVRVYIRFRPVSAREAKTDNNSKEFDIQFADDEQSIRLRQTETGKGVVEREYRFDKVM